VQSSPASLHLGSFRLLPRQLRRRQLSALPRWLSACDSDYPTNGSLAQLETDKSHRPFCTRKYVYVVQNCTFV